MYVPKSFEQQDQTQLIDIINNYAFATLVTYSDSGIEANHLPMFIKQVNGSQVLQGHIAKSNPLWKNVNEHSEVLVIFQGPNAYISPNYYPTKHETGKAVPTWNYISVHVKGTISYISDDNWKMAMLHKLTDQHEVEQLKPWSIDDAPKSYIDKMLSAIVGLEIHIGSIQGKWKISQNQPAINQQGVISGLTECADGKVKDMVAFIKSQLKS